MGKQLEYEIDSTTSIKSSYLLLTVEIFTT